MAAAVLAASSLRDPLPEIVLADTAYRYVLIPQHAAASRSKRHLAYDATPAGQNGRP